MRIGVNLMVWTGPFTEDDLPLLERCRDMGVGAVEIPILALDRFRPETVHEHLTVLGLECSTSAGVPAGCSLLIEDERSRGIDWIRRVIEISAGLGSRMVSGPFYSPVGQLTGRGPTRREWDSALVGLSEVASIASDYGLTINLEPLNRFETHFLNTAADAVRLVEEVGKRALGVQLDTFHMNIEEKSLTSAIRSTGVLLKHFHCSENDRGIVGTGHIDWHGVISALRETGYPGWLTIESFGQPMPELAAAASVWRALAPSADELARQSLRFLEGILSQDRTGNDGEGFS